MNHPLLFALTAIGLSISAAHADPVRVAQAIPGMLPASEVAAVVRSAGFVPISPAMRRGNSYVLRASAPDGQEVRVIVGARSGEIVSASPVVAAAPNGERLGPYERMEGAAARHHAARAADHSRERPSDGASGGADSERAVARCPRRRAGGSGVWAAAVRRAADDHARGARRARPVAAAARPLPAARRRACRKARGSQACSREARGRDAAAEARACHQPATEAAPPTGEVQRWGEQPANPAAPAAAAPSVPEGKVDPRALPH